MHARSIVILAAAFAAIAGCSLITGKCPSRYDTNQRAAAAAVAATAFVYPPATRGDVVDTYHGVEVADPYRWLEDPDSPETRAWIDAENAVTFPYLESIPERADIAARLTELWNYERFGVPFEEGGRYFYTRNDGLQDQSVLYVADALDAEPRVLLDPNTWSEDGTISLGGYSVSDDGQFIAYAISDGGSDWRTWKVVNIDTGEELNDRIEWSKFSGASWTEGAEGFFYSRYDEPVEGEELEGANYNQKVYYHRVGRPQADDVLVYADPDNKEWGFGAGVTDDGDYMIISVWQGTQQENDVYYAEIGGLSPDGFGNLEIVKLLTGFEADYTVVGNEGSMFLFQTTLDAPKGRVIAIDVENPERDNWVEVIPESDNVLRGVSHVGGRLVATYLEDAKTLAKVYETDGAHVRDVDLPAIGSAFGFGGDADDTETFYQFSSYTYPTTIYRYDIVTGESTLFKQPDIDFNPDDYITEQVFYESKDGTRIPMFITRKRDVQLDATAPTLLYGYGGFNISLTPGFSVSRLVWMETGGIYAVPNLRGGGEYGKDWHEAGIKTRKQNVFDDFIAAAEWLLENDYTTTERLAIAGGSNGGLLVGACMTQRPDLFGACLPAVGVMDMIRFDLFTIGWAWRSDYGHPAENEDEFLANLAYSPYHNLQTGTCYPATLVTTADHDDRVVPAHSFKFAAALQHAQGCDNPVMIRIETRAGHGAGTPISKRIEQIADQYAFLVDNLKME